MWWDTSLLLVVTRAFLTFRACVPLWTLQGQFGCCAAITKHATTVKFGNELQNISINDVMLPQVLRVHNSANAKERFINWEYALSYGGKMVPRLAVL